MILPELLESVSLSASPRDFSATALSAAGRSEYISTCSVTFSGLVVLFKGSRFADDGPAKSISVFSDHSRHIEEILALACEDISNVVADGGRSDEWLT